MQTITYALSRLHESGTSLPRAPAQGGGRTWLPAPDSGAGGPPPMPPPLRGQRSRTRLGRSFHLSANEWLEPAKQQEGGSSSTVRRAGPGASAAAAVPAPRAHRAHCTGIWSPAPRKPPRSLGLPSLGEATVGTALGGRQRASVHSFLGNPKAVWLSSQEWEGAQRERASTQCGFQVSGPRLERPPGLPPETRGPGRRRAAPRTAPSAHLAKTNALGGKDHTRQQEEQGGGRCRHRKPYGVSLSTPARQVTGRTTQQRAGINGPCVIPNTTQPRIRGESASHAATPSSGRAF